MDIYPVESWIFVYESCVKLYGLKSPTLPCKIGDLFVKAGQQQWFAALILSFRFPLNLEKPLHSYIRAGKSKKSF